MLISVAASCLTAYTPPAMRLLVLGIVWIGLCVGGCQDLECGVGTHAERGVCVPNILTRCGSGTVFERGYCVATDVGVDADVQHSETGDVIDDTRDADGT